MQTPIWLTVSHFSYQNDAKGRAWLQAQGLLSLNGFENWMTDNLALSIWFAKIHERLMRASFALSAIFQSAKWLNVLCCVEISSVLSFPHAATCSAQTCTYRTPADPTLPPSPSPVSGLARYYCFIMVGRLSGNLRHATSSLWVFWCPPRVFSLNGQQQEQEQRRQGGNFFNHAEIDREEREREREREKLIEKRERREMEVFLPHSTIRAPNATHADLLRRLARRSAFSSMSNWRCIMLEEFQDNFFKKIKSKYAS